MFLLVASSGFIFIVNENSLPISKCNKLSCINMSDTGILFIICGGV